MRGVGRVRGGLYKNPWFAAVSLNKSCFKISCLVQPVYACHSKEAYPMQMDLSGPLYSILGLINMVLHGTWLITYTLLFHLLRMPFYTKYNFWVPIHHLKLILSRVFPTTLTVPCPIQREVGTIYPDNSWTDHVVLQKPSRIFPVANNRST